MFLNIAYNVLATILFSLGLFGYFSGSLSPDEHFKFNIYGMLALIIAALYKDK